MAARKSSRQTFADIVAQVPPAPPATGRFSYDIPHPWITVEGQRWSLRGSAFEGRNLHKLLCQEDLLVLHEYLGRRTTIPAEEREAFWVRAAASMRDSEYSDFVGYEYEHTDASRCLVVYESC